MVARTYAIPVDVGMPGGHGSAAESEACLQGTSLVMDRLALELQWNATYTHPSWHNAIRFPRHDHMDIIHGHGTVALEFERELATLAQSPSARPCGLKSSPDFVISDMHNGITLSGVCMAFEGTKTQVLGASPGSRFWEYVSGRYSSDIPREQNYEYKYWEGIEVPMAAIPWATFSKTDDLLGVMEVNSVQMHAASVVAREQYGLDLEPHEAVPLAVALYNEDFRRLVAQVRDEEGEGPTIGVILRSRRADRSRQRYANNVAVPTRSYIP